MSDLSSTYSDAYVLAIIPARGGSKGIPGKNIKMLGGKPLLYYTAEAARKSGAIDSMILSTDSEEIARVGRACGLDVPFIRPSYLALDDTPMQAVVEHVLDGLPGDKLPEIIVLLQPTSPFRDPKTITKALEMLEDPSVDSVVSVVEIPLHYSPFYAMKVNQSGELENFVSDGHRITRRQDCPPTYSRCGVVYAFKYASFKRTRSIYGSKCLPLILGEEESINLDSPEDWSVAENVISTRMSGQEIGPQ